ncbi:hypothetical protein ACFFJ7_03240 [Pseudochelatococcus lubricantis]|uniref:hypothetical protein n=1 Tax=Pseudochelatococcus lubricantis TaxID=1538102 RepID=UPI0035ED4A7C
MPDLGLLPNSFGAMPFTPAESGLHGARKAGEASIAFENALSRNGVDPAPEQPPIVAGGPAVVTVPATAGEQGRTPDPETTSSITSGDSILNGLKKMRGIFDEQQGRIASVAQENLSVPNALAAMQIEVAKYSMLLDMSSKLTGKASQAIDQLMKGQ